MPWKGPPEKIDEGCTPKGQRVELLPLESLLDVNWTKVRPDSGVSAWSDQEEHGGYERGAGSRVDNPGRDHAIL